MSDDDEAEDLEQRRAAARVTGRTGYARLGGHAQGEGRTVPCRQCGTPVQISPWVLEVAKQLSEGILHRRGEPPLEDGELTMCPPCGARWEAKHLECAVELGRRVGQLVRDVKLGKDMTDEQIAWLRRHGYGDSADGIEAIMRRRREEGSKEGRRRGDK